MNSPTLRVYVARVRDHHSPASAEEYRNTPHAAARWPSYSAPFYRTVRVEAYSVKEAADRAGEFGVVLSIIPDRRSQPREQ